VQITSSLPFFDEIVTLRRLLHMEPELSGKEQVTARILENYLTRFSPSHLITQLGGYGLAAIFDSGQAGPSVLLRADMDALPIHECNEVIYRSTYDGVSHKCGHDGHMAIIAGLAPMLKKEPPTKGRVILLFQPAEETGQGAKAVIEDPQFEALHADYCFALHNLPNFPLGEVVVKDQVFAAASVGLQILLQGATSHAAYPERGNSPSLALAELIQTLDGLNKSFQTEGLFSLLTVVSARLGEESFGITPGEAKLMVTLRSYDDDTLERLRSEALRCSEKIASAHQLGLEVSWHDYFPATRNHPEATGMLRASAYAQGWTAQPPDEPFRWSEDFGWFTRQTPGALFGLGAGYNLALHSADYDFPEALLEPGIQLFWGIIKNINFT
jgi:amidohydrolase